MLLLACNVCCTENVSFYFFETIATVLLRLGNLKRQLAQSEN